ncbi:MAG: transcription elongation factor GreA [Spirochaetales bacterium]|nr:transcription elongation factor GreA [Spirochaetales bacterium]
MEKTEQENVIAKVQEKLNEEKWTRAALKSYSINNFEELDEIVEETVKEELQDEVKAICDEHIQHTKNSIVALYLSGIISLSKQMVDDSNIVMLIDIFSDNRRWNIVEFLCNRILEFGENKYALRTLAQCYENENENDKVTPVLERLIRVDYEEADIVKQLAEQRENEGKLEEAVDYYKKAIHRYINKKQFSNVRDIWQKLIEYVPQETELFFQLETKISKILSGERSAQLLSELYTYYREKENWDTGISILKKILEYDPQNEWARKEIVECYRGKFGNHSHFDEYVKVSNLNQSWRNVHDAIDDFEKHIAFDAGNFVFHRSWGVGRIRSIEGDTIIIDFARKRNHSMSLKMAVSALSSLPKDHIWVLKAIWSKEKLREKVKNDISWTLRTIIKSYDNLADMKKIKSELVPSILSPAEWSSWSVEARNVLKKDPVFGNHPEKLDQYMVRENPMTFEEKLFNRFKAEKSFFAKINAIQDFFASDQEPDSEYVGEMISYLTSFLKSFVHVNEQVVASYLLVQRIVAQYPYLNPGLDYDFQDLMKEMDNPEEIFQKIENAELKRRFLVNVQKTVKDWPSVYARLFPHYLSRFVVDELVENGHFDVLKNLYIQIVEKYREYREAFIWLARNTLDDQWFKDIPIPYEKILIAMVHLLDITYREINNRRDVSVNRKLNKQIHNFLFREGRVEEYINNESEDAVSRLYTLIADVRELDPSISIDLKNKILERFPNFKFFEEAEREYETVSRGLLATPKSFEAKQKELKHILEVEVPKNSKEIGDAAALGDLRENAEYKAAKERQDILNSTAAKMKDELDRVEIIDPKDVSIDSVGFGNRVVLENLDSGKTETYSILGPWESDPDQHIISYLSPFGNELLDHSKDEEFDFIINERSYHYRVKEIERVK